MEEKVFYRKLVERYKTKTASDEELIVFFQLLSEGKLDEELGAGFLSEEVPSATEENQALQPAFTTGVSRMTTYRSLARAGIAACVIGAVSAGIFFLARKGTVENNQPVVVRAPSRSTDILPGRSRATLVLADGSSISLDSISKGEIAKQGTLKIVKPDSGSVAYEGIASVAANDRQSFNTIATPRGGEYRVTLPDGTKVWLNAASTLRLPVAFTGSEKAVELDGEAYFEVAHHTSPFTVKLKNGINIQVLGTDFNIHCYTDEPVTMTLLKGSIRVQSEEKSAVLKPGQEVTVKQDGNLDIARNADMEQAIAWKNGLFEFNRADLTTIMKQVERWYDVNVIYSGETSDKQFVGKVPRNSNLSEVLSILELSKIHFTVDGRKIIVR